MSWARRLMLLLPALSSPVDSLLGEAQSLSGGSSEPGHPCLPWGWVISFTFEKLLASKAAITGSVIAILRATNRLWYSSSSCVLWNIEIISSTVAWDGTDRSFWIFCTSWSWSWRGVSPIDLYKEEFKEAITCGIHSYQVEGMSPTKDLKWFRILQLCRSTMSFEAGWYAITLHVVIPCSLQMASTIWLLNSTPLSDKRTLGVLYLQKTSSINALATDVACLSFFLFLFFFF